MSNLFETATREKYRFVSTKGALTTEQLWDLKLEDLDGVARTINNELKSMSEESFISTRSNPSKKHSENKLDLVKHVIGVKQAEDAVRASEAERRRQKARLAEALANKQDQKLANMTEEQIRAELDKLD